MRCSQPFGITEEAEAFLLENAMKLNVCSHCHKDDGYITEKIGETGMFNDIPIEKIRLIDGTWAEEFEQNCIWSSGPMIWFGLRLDNGTEFKWSEKDMEE